MDTKRKGRKSGLLSIVMAAVTLATNLSRAAEIGGNIEYKHSETKDNSVVELNVMYKPTVEINGFTFIDFAKDGTYFGSTSLTRDLPGPINAELRVSHGTDPINKIDIGASASIPVRNLLQKIGIQNAFLKGEVYGAAFDTTDSWRYEKGSALAAISGGCDLPRDMKLFFFGDSKIPMGDEKGGFTYGEVDVSKKIDLGKYLRALEGQTIEVAYNPSISGRAMEIKHKVALRYLF